MFRHTHNDDAGFEDNHPFDSQSVNRPADDELFGWVMAAYRDPQRFSALVARQEEVIRGLAAQEESGRKNIMLRTAGIARQRKQQQLRVTRMRLAQEWAEWIGDGNLTPESSDDCCRFLVNQGAMEPPHRAICPRFSGRNLQGLPLYIGDLQTPSAGYIRRVKTRLRAWFGVGYLGVLLMAIVPSRFGLSGFGTLALTAGFLGFVRAGIDWFQLYSVRKFANLIPIRDLAARTGAPELSYLLVAREKGIEPRCIIDGTEYYDVNELGDAGVLLRAAESPPGTSELLRPAAGRSAEENNLVRPSNGGRD